MRLRPAFALLSALVSLAIANPITPPTIVLEERNGIPDGFISNGPASPDTILNLRIAQVSNNIAGLEKALYDVSTPGNPLYGQHLSKEEVRSAAIPSFYSNLVTNSRSNLT